MTEQLEEVVSTDNKAESIDEEDNQTTVETTNTNKQPEDEEETKTRENNIENEIEVSDNSAAKIDFSSINYKDFEKINQEQIDLYYMLNDNKNNVEFLNEDLVTLSKREEEIKALKEKEKEEFDFKMEELVGDENEVKVDLTGIIDDLETEKEK